MNKLTPEQAEIIDLLRNEIAEMVQSDTSAFQNNAPEPQINRLSELETELEHLANACELAGLLGLVEASRHLSNNFKLLQQHCPLPKTRSAFVLQWAMHTLGYLNYIGDDEKEPLYVNNLLNFLASDQWPAALDDKNKESLQLKFTDSDLSSLNEQENQLPKTATSEMASLVPGADVRADLLNGMLQELPEQVRIFEASINNFMESSSLEQLTNARRMAHTLKGAANIVGVSGVANLMHFIEDLLEIAAKQKWQHIPAGFADLLLEASDCLAMMSEFLCGIGSAPNNVREIQQQVLDWVHAIHSGTTPGTTPGATPGATPETTPGTTPSTSTHQQGGAHANSDSAHEDSPKNEEIDFEAFYAATHALRDANESDPVRTQFNNPLNERISGLDAELESIIAGADELAKDTKQAASLSDDEKHFINLPETTAHELLRIAGEVHIGNTQISAQVESMQASIQLTDRYHKQIRAMAAELETIVQSQGALQSALMGYAEGEIDPLEMERFSELHTFSNRLLELTTDSYEAVSHIDAQIEDLSNLAYTQTKLNEDNQSLLLEMRLVPVNILSSRFTRCVRQACRLTGKAAKLQIQGENVLLDSRVLNRIADPVMHLLRNAVDHGLESNAQQRRDAGKSPEGNITLIFRHQGETITIECIDDGIGLNYDKIHQIALEKRLVDRNKGIDHNYLNQIILMPGFSTREHASQTSGRGIGLDAVMADVKVLKGNLTITSEQGAGCKAIINVPSSILSGHALVVRSNGSAGNQILSLVSRSIEQIIYISANDIAHTAKGMHYIYNGEQIPVYNINDLTDIHQHHNDQLSALVIARKHDESLVGVAVEAILASQNMVIKPLNSLSVHPPGVVGATILGDGTVSPVIDLQELPGMVLSQDELSTLRKQRLRIASLESKAYLTPPVVLIVDDSLSARRSLAQFVSDMGMEACTAKDGFEAISVLEEKKPAFMLVDLEMPRMNGLELTAHIRSREDTKDIPVIMITSRSTEKHRELAERAGVNNYLNKPWSEEELMATIQQQIA